MISYGYTEAAMILFRSHLAQDLNGIQRHILLMLCSYANNEGLCWPGHKELAKACGYGLTAVKSNLNALEQKGYVTITQRRDKAGDLATNLYQINIEKAAPADLSGKIVGIHAKTTEERLFDVSWCDDGKTA